MPKLNYKIIGKRKAEGEGAAAVPHDIWDIEWSHADGPFKQTKIVPTTHPPDIVFEEVADESRAVIKDEISVPPDAPESLVEKLCLEKRPKLAAALGVEV